MIGWDRQVDLPQHPKFPFIPAVYCCSCAHVSKHKFFIGLIGASFQIKQERCYLRALSQSIQVPTPRLLVPTCGDRWRPSFPQTLSTMFSNGSGHHLGKLHCMVDTAQRSIQCSRTYQFGGLISYIYKPSGRLQCIVPTSSSERARRIGFCRVAERANRH